MIQLLPLERQWGRLTGRRALRGVRHVDRIGAMRSIVLVTVPYDSGQRGRRMGAGPLHLLDAGAIALLEARGHPVRHVPIELDGGFWTEVGAATRLQQMISSCVGPTGDERVVVLSGNCNSSIGTVAA